MTAGDYDEPGDQACSEMAFMKASPNWESFAGPDAAHGEERVGGGGLLPRHGPQRRVPEDDEGGHVLLVGERPTQRLERLVKPLVIRRVIDRGRGAGTPTRTCGGHALLRSHRARHLERPARLEEVGALLGEIDRRVVPRQLADEAAPHALATDLLPLLARELLADGPGRKRLVPPARDLLGHLAGEDVRVVQQPERGERGRTKARPSARGRSVESSFCMGMLASNTSRGVMQLSHHGAVAFGEALGEVLEQIGPPTTRGLAVVDHAAQLIFRHPASRFVADLLDEVELLRNIRGAEEKNALGREPVTPGAAGFLIVALDVLRQIVVDDETDVGLVDAHAESHGGADDLDACRARTRPGSANGRRRRDRRDTAARGCWRHKGCQPRTRRHLRLAQ
jgi:hypothetical protein